MQYEMSEPVEFAKFANFKPTAELKALVKAMVQELEWVAPSDAAIRVVVEKNKKLFRCVFRVVSQGGVFIAEAVSEQPLQLVGLIDRRIRRQFKDWISHRKFSGEEDAR